MGGRLALSALSVIVLAGTAPAQIFTDGFESYTAGANPLDKNVAGPNAAPNGSGNPWFGPAPPNLRVVSSGDTTATGSPVNAHSGSQMVRGSAPSDLDENWVNIAYRLNGGNPYAGNASMTFWFYDPLGSGGANYRDFGALGFYNTAPNNTDYPGTGSLNSSTQIQRLSLGASSSQGAGFDATVYQARVVGATDGYNSAGWFNTIIGRTVGWHMGEIDVGPALPDNTNNVTFLIDGVTALTHNSVLSFGYNVLELNMNYGPTTGYMDDITFSAAVPEPSTLLLTAGGLLTVRRRRSKST
jgi:hypothetical protein